MPFDPEEYARNWPGSPETEAEAAAAITNINRAPDIAGPVPQRVADDVPRTQHPGFIELPEDEEPFEPQNNFSTPSESPEPRSSIAAEDLALEALANAREATRGSDREFLLIAAQVFIGAAQARATREYTAAISKPPVAYRMDGRSGEITERLTKKIADMEKEVFG